MGSVYEARQLNLDRHVAVKFLHPPLEHVESERESFERRFAVEAASLAKLSHANIVSVFDYGQTDDGRSFLVMELVEGRPLSRLLKEEAPLVPRRGIDLMLQVCRALQSAHDQGVVHRDLKPSNLLIRVGVDNKEQLKVVDFGLVKLTREDQTITLDGLVMGSPHYMSPEQVKGGDTDERSDIYSIGALLFRCVTARPPFHGNTSTATMLAHLQQPIPNLADMAPDLDFPPGLERIIHRCMDKDPEHRYQHVNDLIRALEEQHAIAPGGYTSGSSLPAVLPSPLPAEPEVTREVAPPTPPRRRSPVPVLIGGGAVVVILVVAALVLPSMYEPRLTPADPPTNERDHPEQTSAKDHPPGPPAGLVNARLSFTSDPSGAEVLMEGEVLGVTPFQYETTASPGSTLRRFQFRLDNYQGRTVEHDMASGGDQSVNAKMLAMPGGAASPEPALEVQPAPPQAVTVRVSPGAADPTPEPEPETTPDGYKTSPYE